MKCNQLCPGFELVFQCPFPTTKTIKPQAPPMHVGDFIFCWNDTFKRNGISELKRIFNVRTHENGALKFLGLALKQTKNGITYTVYLYLNRHEKRKVFKKKWSVESRGGGRSKKIDRLNDMGSQSDLTWYVFNEFDDQYWKIFEREVTVQSQRHY